MILIGNVITKILIEHVDQTSTILHACDKCSKYVVARARL